MDNNSLYHYGVLGMRWGVRKNKDSRVLGNKKRSKKDDTESVKDMSDSELRQKINRLQMEKQYAQLTKKDVSAGQKFVTDILTNAAKQTATNYTSKYMTKGIDKIVEKAIGKK